MSLTFSPPLVPGSECVDKLYANLPGTVVPLNIFSSWGGLSCHVKLTSVPGSLIRLTITSFLIEPSDCVSDALMVYDALLPMRGRILHRCVHPTANLSWPVPSHCYSLHVFVLCCRLCETVSSPFSLVSTSNVMLLSFRMSNGNKSFRGHFETIAEESMGHVHN